MAASQRDYDVDVFNFNHLLNCNYYAGFRKISKSWDTVYRNAKVSVTAQFHMSGSGLIKKPAFAP